MKIYKKTYLAIFFVILLVIGFAIERNMATKDISPKFKLQTAEMELETPEAALPMGESLGGLSMFSSSFKRGYGDEVFGSDSNGIWLGAAEFADAPFRVEMDGSMFAKSATFTDGDNVTIIDGTGLISGANFDFDYYFANNEITTTSDSYVDVSGSSLTFNVTNDYTRILLLFTYIGLNSGSSVGNLTYGVSAYINVDGTDYNPVAITRSLADSSYNVAASGTVTTQRILQFGKGSHTVKIRWKRVGGGGTAKMYDRTLSYVMLGK